MREFKMPKGKLSDYKSIGLTEDDYIRAVYRENKSMLEKSIAKPANQRKTKEDAFVNLVKETKKRDRVGINKAIQSELNKSYYADDTEGFFKENAMTALKDDKDAYKWFREHTKDKKGRYTSFDINKLKYEGSGSYTYDGPHGLLHIDFSNSPYGVYISY